MGQQTKIMDKEAVRRAILRMAHEILEKNKGTQGLCLVGIRTRGVVLAQRLRQAIQNIEGIEIPAGILDITLYRDDLQPLMCNLLCVKHRSLLIFRIKK